MIVVPLHLLSLQELVDEKDNPAIPVKAFKVAYLTYYQQSEASEAIKLMDGVINSDLALVRE
jgi:hypothetical protein